MNAINEYIGGLVDYWRAPAAQPEEGYDSIKKRVEEAVKSAFQYGEGGVSYLKRNESQLQIITAIAKVILFLSVATGDPELALVGAIAGAFKPEASARIVAIINEELLNGWNSLDNTALFLAGSVGCASLLYQIPLITKALNLYGAMAGALFIAEYRAKKAEK